MNCSTDSDLSASFEPIPHTLESIQIASQPLAILGLPASIALSDHDVRRAYHTLARQFHPDKLASSSSSQLRQQYGEVFIKISEAYHSMKHIDARRRWIQDQREIEIWNEIELKRQQDEQGQQHRRNGEKPPSTMRPNKSKTTSTKPDAQSNHAPNSSSTSKTKPSFAAGHYSYESSPFEDTPTRSVFPSFSGVRFKSGTFNYGTRSSSLSSCNSTPTPISSSSHPNPRRRQLDVLSLSSSASQISSEQDFASTLSHWLRAFADEMADERREIERQTRMKYTSTAQQRLLEEKIGANIFSHTPNVRSNQQSSTALVSVHKPATVCLAPTTLSSIPSQPLSRLQQLRARQSGVTQIQSNPPSSSCSSHSASPTSSVISSSLQTLLTTGDRFSLRTVASHPGAKPTPPVSVSIWVSNDFTLLQWRLSASTYAHPDGAIPIDSIVVVKKIQKSSSSLPSSSSSSSSSSSLALSSSSSSIPSRSCWLSLIQSNGSTLTLEAKNTLARDTWVAALQQLIKR